MTEEEMVILTAVTDDPKLGALEEMLVRKGIPSKREGMSFHIPILKVPKDDLKSAMEILDPIKSVPDDHSAWTREESTWDMFLRAEGLQHLCMQSGLMLYNMHNIAGTVYRSISCPLHERDPLTKTGELLVRNEIIHAITTLTSTLLERKKG